MADADLCAIVLLAAGASTRMGRAKQLLPVAGQPLVRRSTEIALAAGLGPVVVVLGASAPEVAPVLDGVAARVVINGRWAEGMGSSVRIGVRAALDLHPGLHRLIIALADQPGVSVAHFRALAAAQRQTGCAIVASDGAGAPQPPVLFTEAWFARLLELRGDAGAREILRAEAGRLARVSLAEAADLDTPDDYRRYCSDFGAEGPNKA